MKYLRLATYLALFAALFIVTHPRVSVLPVTLAPASYKLQAEQLIAHIDVAKVVRAADLKISGGLPAAVAWPYYEGPDFDVWSTVIGKDSSRAVVGIYAGMHPQIDPPSEGLVLGSVGGIPVLWWQHRSSEYRTVWDALIPHRKIGFLHVWIASYAPERVAEIAAQLKSVKFVAEASGGKRQAL